MDKYILKDFSKILKNNHQEVRRALSKDTNAMRVYDKALESFKFTVDIFAGYVVLTDYSQDALSDDELVDVKRTIASALYMSFDNIIYKHKKKGEEFSSNLDEIHTVIKEDGALYNVELAKKQDVGFFLDNYRARLLVKELSFNRSVLNLFSYTGAYSVQAARGGALRVVSVDTSKSALKIAEENLKLNSFSGELFECVQKDVFEYISSVKQKEFDIIIADVPSFSNSHGGRRENFDVQKDHVRLINEAARILKKEGIILFRTNMSTFSLYSDKLEDFKIFNYTREMLSPGFTKKSQIVKTFVLKAYDKKKFYINSKNKKVK